MFFVDEDARGVDTVWWSDGTGSQAVAMLTALDVIPGGNWTGYDLGDEAGELWSLIVDAVNRSNP